MGKKVCFIGHRRIGYGPIEERLEKAIIKEIDSGCKFFTMGTHGAFDRLALHYCRNLKKTHPDIDIEVALTSLYSIKNGFHYKDVKTVIYNIEEVHFKRKIIESNRQMIDFCDTLIAYVNEKEFSSGAKIAYNYAKKKNLRIINIFDEKDDPTYGMTKIERLRYYEESLAKYKNRPDKG